MLRKFPRFSNRYTFPTPTGDFNSDALSDGTKVELMYPEQESWKSSYKPTNLFRTMANTADNNKYLFQFGRHTGSTSKEPAIDLLVTFPKPLYILGLTVRGKHICQVQIATDHESSPYAWRYPFFSLSKDYQKNTQYPFDTVFVPNWMGLQPDNPLPTNTLRVSIDTKRINADDQEAIGELWRWRIYGYETASFIEQEAGLIAHVSNIWEFGNVEAVQNFMMPDKYVGNEKKPARFFETTDNFGIHYTQIFHSDNCPLYPEEDKDFAPALLSNLMMPFCYGSSLERPYFFKSQISAPAGSGITYFQSELPENVTTDDFCVKLTFKFVTSKYLNSVVIGLPCPNEVGHVGSHGISAMQVFEDRECTQPLSIEQTFQTDNYADHVTPQHSVAVPYAVTTDVTKPLKEFTVAFKPGTNNQATMNISSLMFEMYNVDDNEKSYTVHFSKRQMVKKEGNVLTISYMETSADQVFLSEDLSTTVEQALKDLYGMFSGRTVMKIVDTLDDLSAIEDPIVGDLVFVKNDPTSNPANALYGFLPITEDRPTAQMVSLGEYKGNEEVCGVITTEKGLEIVPVSEAGDQEVQYFTFDENNQQHLVSVHEVIDPDKVYSSVYIFEDKTETGGQWTKVNTSADFTENLNIAFKHITDAPVTKEDLENLIAKAHEHTNFEQLAKVGERDTDIAQYDNKDIGRIEVIEKHEVHENISDAEYILLGGGGDNTVRD